MLLPCLSFWPSSSAARKSKNHKKNDAVSNIKPGETDEKMIPINRMVPRSFVTNIASGHKVKAAPPTTLSVITAASIWTERTFMRWAPAGSRRRTP
jgi:hypothetical protein